jgi:uncharacterized protein
VGGTRVIADSSVLIVLARAGHLPLLRAVAGIVTVPAAVVDETVAAKAGQDVQQLERALEDGWLARGRVDETRALTLAARYPNLGRGEVEAITIALERKDAPVLLDERAARRASRLEGLTPVGTLGIIALAFKRGVIKEKREVSEVLRDVLNAGLWVSPAVIEQFWARLGGRA